MCKFALSVQIYHEGFSKAAKEPSGPAVWTVRLRSARGAIGDVGLDSVRQDRVFNARPAASDPVLC